MSSVWVVLRVGLDGKLSAWRVYDTREQAENGIRGMTFSAGEPAIVEYAPVEQLEAERPDGDAVSISPEDVDETAECKHEQLTGEMAFDYRYTEGFITDGICACSFPPAAKTADSNQICGCCGKEPERTPNRHPRAASR